MKLSVIIVSYMFEDYIEQCLISALGQKTNFDYEILIRDDFSSDKSLEHIVRISEVNRNLKFFEAKENLGTTKNFEYLYSRAKGEYIAILDGDDYWDNMNLLQQSVDYLEDNKDVSMVFCGHKKKYVNNGNLVEPPEVNKWFGFTLNESSEVTTDILLNTNWVGFGKVFRRVENLIQPWMYDLPYLDWGLNYNISLTGKIKFLNFPGGVYRIHDRGIFSGEDEQKRIDNIEKSKFLIKMNHNKDMNKIPIILHCTENYLQNSLNLIRSLNLYHDNLQYYLYTLNFNYTSDIHNLFVVPVTSEEIDNNMTFVGNKNDVTNKNMFKSVFYKSKVVLHTIEKLNLEYAIYIDSDSLPTGEISDLFGYINQVEDYPLIQEGIFEYQINYGRGNPFHLGGFDETNILEYPLMNKHHIPIKNRTKYSVTSVMVYNKKCKQFFKEYDWMNELAFDMDIEEIKYYYPFSDETTMNVLLWKYNYNKRLPLMQMNIDEVSNTKEYYESNYDSEKEITSYVRVPSKEHRNNIMFFHGIKGESSSQVLDLQRRLFEYKIDNNLNRLYLYPKVDFNRELTVEMYDGDTMLYTTISKYNNDLSYWYSTQKQFSEYQNLVVKIKDKNRIIYQVKIPKTI
jgi:glycosyltransferase involved in cell wall biosynthesis